MIYGIAADLVLLLHLLFIVFAVLGGLLLLWRRWMWLVHLPAAVWAVYIEVTGKICPLTPLENKLRRLAGERGYEGGFMEHYIVPVIYPEGLTRDIQWILAAAVLVINLAVYWFVFRVRR